VRLRCFKLNGSFYLPSTGDYFKKRLIEHVIYVLPPLFSQMGMYCMGDSSELIMVGKQTITSFSQYGNYNRILNAFPQKIVKALLEKLFNK